MIEFRLPFGTPIGIDLGSRWIKAVQLGKTPRGWRVEACAIVPRRSPDEPLGGDEITILCDVLYRGGFEGNKVVVSVPPDRLMTGMLDVPSGVSDAPLKQIVRMEFARMHGCDPQSFEMVSWELPKSSRLIEQTQVLATGCPHTHANALLDMLESNGLNVEALDTGVCALQRAVRPLMQGTTGIFGILDLGWNACNVLVLHSGVVIYERSLPEVGLGKLHETLEGQFSLDTDEVDVLLGEVGVSQDLAEQKGGKIFERAQSLIIAHFDRAIEDMRAPFSYAVRQYEGASVNCVLLTGGGGSIASLDEHLGEVLNVKTRTISPVDLAEIPRELLGRCAQPAMTTAVGLGQFGC